MAIETNANKSGASSCSEVVIVSRQQCLAVLLLCGIFLLFHDTNVARRAMEEHNVHPIGKPDEGQIQASAPFGDGAVSKLVHDQRNMFFDQLRSDYGNETFAKMFLQEDPSIDGDQLSSRGRTIYTSPRGLSWNRLKRKLMIKVLEAKIAAAQRPESQHTSSSSSSNNRVRSLQDPGVVEERFHSKFVWATGGHSSSAGHGNFLSESYTAVLERAVRPIFASLGIEFVAKPYAMGGTPSGEEVALCIEQIFGDDIDLLVWDYGMMDSARNLQWRQLLYTYHTALGKNRPAALGIDLGGDKTRVKIYAELEQLGMTVFYENQKVIKQMKDAIPDSQGLTDEEIDQMPPFVKQLRCGSGLERGEPGCRTFKYNETICPRRKGMTSWHPGWKMHAFSGNSLALFLVEVLLDAVEELDSKKSDKGDNMQSMLEQFRQDEAESYARVLESDIPKELSAVANWILGSEHEVPFGNVNIRDLYKRQAFCHTALLPSDLRYKGLHTEHNNDTSESFESYMGIPKPRRFDPVPEVDTGMMRLAYDPKERDNCPEKTAIDFKDFYFLSSKEGWKSLTIPNDAAQQYYKVDTADMMGMILMCLTECDWGECKDSDMRSQFDKGLLEMTVNGVEVTEFTKVGICWALKGNDNIYRWPPNDEKKYEIKARLQSQERGQSFSYLRFSSFILV